MVTGAAAVWAASGGQCGKYRAASMRIQLDGLEHHGGLVDGVDRPVPEAGQGHCPGQGCRHDEAGDADLKLVVTRSLPRKKDGQATIESKDYHLHRKHGLQYRYDTDAGLRVLNRLWRLADDRFNSLTPTRKPSSSPSPRSQRPARHPQGHRVQAS